MSDERKVSLREEVARLKDALENGIKYDKRRNIYILVWTKRQIERNRRTARKLWKKLNVQ